MEKIINGVLGTLYKVPTQEVAELLKKSDGSDTIDEDKILQFIIDKDKERVAALKADSSTKFNDAHKRATKEVWERVEKELKEKFGIESELQGEELLAHVVETLPEKYKSTGKKVADLTEDDIKKHPVYVKAERDFKKQLADKDVETEKTLKEKETEWNQKEILSEVKSKGLEIFNGLGEVILPADASKAEIQRQRLLYDEIASMSYQKDDKGNYIILKKDGTRAEDAHGHALDFDSFVKSIAQRNFEFKVAKDRQTPANGSSSQHQHQQQATKYAGAAPKDKKEYVALLTNSELSYDEKQDVKSTYGQQFISDN